MNETDKSIEADAARFRWVVEAPGRAEDLIVAAEDHLDPREVIDRKMLDEARRLLVPKPVKVDWVYPR
jgi:hypothetical protein